MRIAGADLPATDRLSTWEELRCATELAHELVQHSNGLTETPALAAKLDSEEWGDQTIQQLLLRLLDGEEPAN